MSAELTTIATFENPAEAHLARLQLENEGIPAVITDEATATCLWYYGTAIRGAQLQVFQQDAERAQQLLDQIESLSPETPWPLDAEEDDPLREQLEADVQRAWRAAVLGVIITPVLMLFNIYSVWLLLRIMAGGHPLPESVRRSFWMAWAANAVAVLVSAGWIVLIRATG